MPLDITTFKAGFGGGVRPNLFKVSLHFPTGIPGFSLAGRTGEVLVKAASLPADTIAPIEVAFPGRQLKIPGDRTFAEWTVTIYNHQDFGLRNAFEGWMNIMNSHRGNVGVTNPADYFSDAEVAQLDRNDDVLKTYYMTDIWPSEVGAIELSFESNNQVEEFPVTFQVNYWTEDAGVTIG